MWVEVTKKRHRCIIFSLRILIFIPFFDGVGEEVGDEKETKGQGRSEKAELTFTCQ